MRLKTTQNFLFIQKTNITCNTHIKSNFIIAYLNPCFCFKPLALGQSLNWECVALLQLLSWLQEKEHDMSCSYLSEVTGKG